LKEKDWTNAWKDRSHPQRIGTSFAFKLPEWDFHEAEDDMVVDL
jgi:ribosomal protein L11 methylase PrmA